MGWHQFGSLWVLERWRTTSLVCEQQSLKFGFIPTLNPAPCTMGGETLTGRFFRSQVHPQPLNPKPETLNPKPREALHSQKFEPPQRAKPKRSVNSLSEGLGVQGFRV